MRNKQVELNPYIYILSKLSRFNYEISVFPKFFMISDFEFPASLGFYILLTHKLFCYPHFSLLVVCLYDQERIPPYQNRIFSDTAKYCWFEKSLSTYLVL